MSQLIVHLHLYLLVMFKCLKKLELTLALVQKMALSNFLNKLVIPMLILGIQGNNFLSLCVMKIPLSKYFFSDEFSTVFLLLLPIIYLPGSFSCYF